MSMIDQARAMRTKTILDVLSRTVRKDMQDAIKALEENRTERAHYLLTQGLLMFDGMSDAWQAQELKREPAA